MDQIWAEALLLISQDFNYKWDATDWLEFKEHNQKYLKETTSMQYVKMNFEIPKNGEGSWLQPKEILNLLIKNKKIRKEDHHRISEEKLGEALTHLAFERKVVRKPDGPRYCYYLNLL